MNVFDRLFSGRCLSELKLLFKVGADENPAELSFLSEVPLCLSELTGSTPLVLPRPHLRPRATALNMENSNNPIFRSGSIWSLCDHRQCPFCFVRQLFFGGGIRLLSLWYTMFSYLACKLLWLDKILSAQIPYMPSGCLAVKAVKAHIMLLTLTLPLSYVGESQRTMLY